MVRPPNVFFGLSEGVSESVSQERVRKATLSNIRKCQSGEFTKEVNLLCCGEVGAKEDGDEAGIEDARHKDNQARHEEEDDQQN